MNRSRFPLFSPSHSSLDCALNRLHRPLSLRVRKFSLEEEVGIGAEHLARQECLAQSDVLQGTPVFETRRTNRNRSQLMTSPVCASCVRPLVTGSRVCGRC